jgi:hypothetical protein
METSPRQSKNSESAGSSPSTKKSNVPSMWELPDGRKFSQSEYAQLKWETRVEILLYEILKKST